MSWDIFLVRTKTNKEDYGDIVDENIICFTKKEIADEIKILAEKLQLQVEDLDTDYMHLRGEGWSIEFCFWDDYESYETVEMQVRGGNEPTEVFRRLKQDLNARIYDMHGKRYVEEDGKSGFQQWKNFTENIIGDLVEKGKI